MNQNQGQVMAALNYSVTGQNINYSTTANSGVSGGLTSLTSGAQQAMYYVQPNGTTLWQYWQNEYYPVVIKESYPIYIQERAMDKGKQAFEILKALMDKGLVKIDKVKDFIEAMDTLLKTL